MVANYETFKGEADYVSPTEVSKETIAKIKARNIKLGKIAIFDL